MKNFRTSFFNGAKLALLILLFPFLLKAADRPNIVWITSEDNSKHFMQLFDPNGAPTPQIESLAEQGLVFINAFSNAPVCSVARSTLISGCLAPRIGTQFHRRTVMVPMPHGLKMFPAYLREAGYYTTNNSKEDYNAIKTDDVWDESSKKASWRKRADGQPFFHVQNYTTTHEGSLHFSEETYREVENETDQENVFIPPVHPKTDLFKYTYARYHDKIKTLDKQIGELLGQLKEDGLMDDTFIFYFGDHGGVLPGSKGYIYETGLEVPLVVYIPKNFRHLVNVEAGSTVNGFVSFIDFGPTVLNLAGIKTPKQMDGKSFLGKNVSAEKLEKQNETFGYADRFDEKYDLVRTIRIGKYKYMRNYQPFNFDALQNNYRYKMLAYEEWRSEFNSGKLNEAQCAFFETRPAEMLFDIKADPYETKNLAGDPMYANELVKLRKAMQKKVKGMPDLSFYPENVLVETAFDNPVQFGQTNKKAIARLIDIADLSLLPFAKAKDKIKAALNSEKPWERYWGLIVCSSFGKEASEFIAMAKDIAQNDSELLNRTRAAEFLALIEAADPRPVIMDALAKTKDGVEACLILNTVVLLKDGKTAYRFSIPNEAVTDEARENINVQRRLLYLQEDY